MKITIALEVAVAKNVTCRLLIEVKLELGIMS